MVSGGEHGDDGDVRRLRETLLPLLKGRASAYVAGHDHDMQYLVSDGLHLAQAGGGGRSLRSVECLAASRFAAERHGFATIRATATTLTIDLMGTTPGAAPLYTCTREKVTGAGGAPEIRDTCPKVCTP